MTTQVKDNYVIHIINMLSDKYGFDRNEAMKIILEYEDTEDTINSKSSREDIIVKYPTYPKVIYPIPFIGVIYDSCNGIKNNYKLYTQCKNKKFKNNLCTTCFKQSRQNDHGKPNAGLLSDRLNAPLDTYTDPRGKHPMPYGYVINKLKLSKYDVIKELEEHHINIPNELWVDKWPLPPKLGYKKTAIVTDDSIDDSDIIVNL